MRRLLTIAIFVALSSQLKAEQFNNKAFLFSISEVETGHKFWKTGRNGEKSQYQFMSYVWYKYTKVPFYYASNRKYQETVNDVAQKHLDQIKSDIKRRNLEINPYNCALVWNGGLGALNKPKKRTIDYGRRVENLYNVFNKTTVLANND